MVTSYWPYRMSIQVTYRKKGICTIKQEHLLSLLANKIYTLHLNKPLTSLVISKKYWGVKKEHHTMVLF